MRDTRDMMREACDKDKVDAWQNDFWTITQEELERLVALVRADERSGCAAQYLRIMRNAVVDAVEAERKVCEALYEHEDVQAPVGNSAWGEAYQDGWIAGAQAYRDAIRARGNT